MTNLEKSHFARAYRGDVAVLEVTDVPGPLLSRMSPPPRPGDSLTVHPFLSGVALVAEEEGVIGDLLERSRSFDEFLQRLRAEGYRVVQESVPAGVTPAPSRTGTASDDHRVS